MKSRLPLVFIMITIVIDAMGIGLILPVMPDLIQEVNGGSLANAAIWGGILTTSFAVMQFLCSPTIGNLSDRFGRRPILLISLAVLALDYLIMALAGSIWLLLLGRLVGGIASATQSTATAYIADISKPEEKSARFGLVGAAFGIGFVFGPLLGGLLAEFGTRAPFYAAAALASANLVLGYLILPETVTDAIRRPFEWRRANPVGALKHIGRLPGVKHFLAIYFVYQVAFFVYPTTWAYYTTASFGWGPDMIGYSLAAFGISIAIVQGLLIRFILKALGEENTVLYAIVFSGFAFIALAFITNGVVAMILTPLTALGAVGTPAMQGFMSRVVPDDAQGELQGVLTSAQGVATIISPIMMTGAFAFFTGPSAPVYLPGAAFLVALALMVVNVTIFVNHSRQKAVASG